MIVEPGEHMNVDHFLLTESVPEGTFNSNSYSMMT
jgi:hypothetical protein